MENVFQQTSHNEEETMRLARQLAEVLTPGTVILLEGDLGAGKSVVARGVIRGLGVTDAYITSPTFTLLNIYTEGRLPVYHFDLYRLSHPDEFTATGAEEYLDGEGVALIEWAEKGGEWIPVDHLCIGMTYDPHHPEWRLIKITAAGTSAHQVLQAFRLHYTDE